MSGTVAVIPIRGTLRTKTRLASQLDAGERVRLMRHMLRHVLDAIERSGEIDRTFIVSRDAGVLARDIPATPRLSVVIQAGEGLNAAIELGRHRAIARGYDTMLALLPDLPVLTPEDLRALIEPREPVVIAPDRHGTGTNALVLRLGDPAMRLHLAFGGQSAARHIAEAERLGLGWATVDTPGLRHDLDTPDDWQALPEAVRRSLADAIHEPAAAGRAGG